MDLDRVPQREEGMIPYELMLSESQERMTVAIRPEDEDLFLALSRRHAVESTVIGRYTDTGKLHITYNGRTCAYVDMDFLESGFPQWEFDAEWSSPEERGLHEPVPCIVRHYHQGASRIRDKALALMPNDTFILDSLGWVQYRLGNHNEAVKYLRAALDKRADAEIAAHLFISENTVKYHVHSALGKLGLGDRKQLAAYARERGLVK